MKTNEDAGAQQVLGLCDWLASLSWAQLNTLHEDSKAIQSKAILDVVEQLLCVAQQLRGAQASRVELLLPYRNELAKQYQQQSYTSAIERLIPLAVEVRRWARRVSEYLLNEVSVDIKTHCESCPWNAELSLEIKHQLLDERSYLEKPTTPLVSTSAIPKKKTSGGGVRPKRGSGGLTNKQELMAAALREWHGYENESLSCINCTPISNEKLARCSGSSKGKLTKEFFDRWLGGNGNVEYKRLCSSGSKALALAIAKLSREGALAVATLAVEALADAKARRAGEDD